MREMNEYFKGILNQILDSYAIIEDLGNTSNDLHVLQIEIAKITGLFKIIFRKLSKTNDLTKDFSTLQKIVGNYLDNYDFSREIELLLKTFSEDQSRVKNIRLSISKSLNDKELIEKIYNLSKKL
jgi:histidyl-tRNA synthetase